jgi:hypothetical protein
MNWPNLDRCDVKRQVRQVSVFFLIGATINIAVAWSCAFWAAPTNGMEGWGSEVTRPNLVAAWVGPPEGFPERPFESGTMYPRRAGVQRLSMSAMHADVDHEDTAALFAAPHFDLELIEAGWPFASFEGGLWHRREWEYREVNDLWVANDLWESKEAFLVNPGSAGWGDDLTMIPLMPKWSGFVVNTVFFGGILFLLFRWASTLRRQAAKGACQESGVNTAAELS